MAWGLEPEGAFARGEALFTAMRHAIGHLEYILRQNTPGNGDKFAMTQRGCFYAKEFLTASGNLDKLDKEQSTDGFTLVALANKLYSENKQE